MSGKSIKQEKKSYSVLLFFITLLLIISVILSSLILTSILYWILFILILGIGFTSLMLKFYDFTSIIYTIIICVLSLGIVLIIFVFGLSKSNMSPLTKTQYDFVYTYYTYRDWGNGDKDRITASIEDKKFTLPNNYKPHYMSIYLYNISLGTYTELSLQEVQKLEIIDSEISPDGVFIEKQTHWDNSSVRGYYLRRGIFIDTKELLLNTKNGRYDGTYHHFLGWVSTKR